MNIAELKSTKVLEVQYVRGSAVHFSFYLYYAHNIQKHGYLTGYAARICHRFEAHNS